MKLPAFCVFLVASLAFFLTTCAVADDAHERTQMGHNITVGPDEEVSEATCFGCSIRIRGHVSGDVTTFGGSVVVEENGQVDGDITTFAGGLRLDRAAAVDGDVAIFGGQLRRDSAATVGGDVATFGGVGWILLIFVLPLALLVGFVVLVVWLIRKLLRPAAPARGWAQAPGRHT